MAKSGRYQLESALPVEDYFDGEDVEQAFDEASQRDEDAINMAKEELKEALNVEKLPGGLEFSTSFLEFDSNNITHAGAYYLVTVKGPKNVIDVIKKAHYKYMEG